MPGTVLGVGYSTMWIKHTKNTFPHGVYILGPQTHTGRAKEIHLSLQNTVPRVLPMWILLSHDCSQLTRLYQCQIRASETVGRLEPSPMAPVSFIGGHNPIWRRFVHLATGCSLGRVTTVDKAGQGWRSRLRVENRPTGEGKWGTMTKLQIWAAVQTGVCDRIMEARKRYFFFFFLQVYTMHQDPRNSWGRKQDER